MNNYNRISYGDHTKSYLGDIYYYYYNDGYYSIIANKLAGLSISYLLLIIMNILTNCIDYTDLLLFDGNIYTNLTTNPTTNLTINTIPSPVFITDYIHMEKWYPKSPYLIICFILYVIYIICNTISFFNDFKKYRVIKYIFNTELNITDNKLRFITWDKIINRIKINKSK